MAIDPPVPPDAHQCTLAALPGGDVPGRHTVPLPTARIKYTRTPLAGAAGVLYLVAQSTTPSSFSTMSTDTVPIPEVPGLPFLGSALDIDFDFPLGTFLKFAEKHGEPPVPMLSG